MNEHRVITYEWKVWAMQVNANYHNGMSEEDAENAAGPEPMKYYTSATCPVCGRTDDKHWLDKKHQAVQQ